MKIRANSILAKLSADQLEQIFGWIASGVTYLEVQKRCAQPPPDGFDLYIHVNTLWRFYTTERRRRHAEDLAESKFNDLNAEHPDQLLQNVRVELAHACYDLAHQPDSSSVNTLARITYRLDLIRIEQQRLILERDHLAEKIRQFNFNAAREAAKHAAQIHKIIETKGPDAEDKTWMVSDLVFGPPPQLPEKTN